MNTQKKIAASGGALAVAALCLNNAAPSYLQYQISPIAPQVMEAYGLSMTQFSSLFSSPMLPAIALSLIVGLLYDKIGVKAMMRIGVTVAALGSLIRLITGGGYLCLFLGTLMTGFSAAFINTGQAKVVSGFYPPEKIQGKIGLINAASTFAMIVSLATTAYFSSVNAAFLVAAAVMILAAVTWYIWGKNPENDAVENTDTTAPSLVDCLKVCLKSKRVWFLAFSLFFVMGALMIVSTWVPTALQSLGMAATTAGYISSCNTVGNLLSCFIGPFLANKLQSIKKVILIYGVVGVLGLIFAWQLTNPILCGIAFVLTGISIGGNIPLAFGSVVGFEEIGPAYAGTASGVVATIQLLGAVVLPTYMIVPLAGSNFSLLFTCAAISLALAAISGWIAHAK